MKIEIVRFFQEGNYNNSKYFLGTLQIFFPEIGLHIRGINVYNDKRNWHFRMPGRRAFSKTLGKEVEYQFICFEEIEKSHEIIGFLKTEGRAFIEKYFIENPKIQEKKIIKHEEPKVLLKEFVDPPPIKSIRARAKSKFAKK